MTRDNDQEQGHLPGTMTRNIDQYHEAWTSDNDQEQVAWSMEHGACIIDIEHGAWSIDIEHGV